MLIVFPSEPFAPRRPDPDFGGQVEAARNAGFEVVLVDTDEMKVRPDQPQGEAVYRGWMLPPERYQQLVELLQARGVELLTDPKAYRYCHHLPEWYEDFRAHTPESLWFDSAQMDSEKVASHFGAASLVVKDYVKSAKHYWNEACFIPRADDLAALQAVVERFLEIRSDSLEGGLVFRRFLELQAIGNHAKSGMPLTLEYRLFFWRGELLLAHRYWEEVAYPEGEPPLELFTALAKKVPSPFFTMDVACDTEGRWWVVELGDGQVAGLPPDLDPVVFYERWMALLSS